MISGYWEEPGDGNDENVSLPCPPRIAFAQLRYPAVAQNRPPVVTDSGIRHGCRDYCLRARSAATQDRVPILVTGQLQPARRRRSGWKPFLYHLSGGEPERRRAIKLKAACKQPTILTAGQVQAILDACTHLRDRLLWAFLWDTGIRIGEALGLRHEDLAAAEGELTITQRANDNRAHAKSATPRTVPVSPEVVRLYADYLHEEYGDLDSDYVFVNLWGQPFGRPWGYPAVYDLVQRLRRDTGVDFDPHWYRHTYATWL
ncbi:MAG: tyrosine-type recombinase/integrase [Pseudonocardiaceae bacterium]